MIPLCAWFVVFPAIMRDTAWWAKLLRPGYRHCLALREDGEGRTLIVDHRGAQLIVTSAPIPVGVMVRDIQREGLAMVLMVTLPPGQGRPPLRPMMTCVEAVKAAMGLHARWIITPAQLARYLRRRHEARAVLPETSQS